MSESPITLAFSLIGIIIGFFALYIQYREKPHLKLEIEKCEHEYQTSESEGKTLYFVVFFKIRNLGVRGTRINDVGLTLLKNGKKKFEFDKKKTAFIPSDYDKWINGDDTARFGVNFAIPVKGERDMIDCLFTVYQTHGNNHINHTSMRRPPKPLM